MSTVRERVSCDEVAERLGSTGKRVREQMAFYGIPVADDGTVGTRESVIVLGNSGAGRAVREIAEGRSGG